MSCLHGQTLLVQAVEEALRLGSSDAASVQYLLLQAVMPPSVALAPLPLSLLGSLSRFERPVPEVSNYDQLLGQSPFQEAMSLQEVGS